MNLGKFSGLKVLVSHSSGKRRFKGKGELTADMISPPLGDFRHTMHVGRGGDVFGDTSFLSNHGGAGNNTDGDSSSTSEKNEGFFARTLRYVRRTPDRPRGDSKDLSPPPPPVSPIIKNAISLPRLDVDSPNGCPVKVLFPNTPENSTHLYGLESGFITLPRLSRTERPSRPPDTGVSSFPSSDSVSTLNSMTSFTLDLGPSLMSEVFGVIDSPVCVKGGPFGPPFGPADDEVGSETTLSLVDSLLREDSDGRTRLYGGEWNYLDFVNGDSPNKSAVRDLSFSSSAEDHSMEAERFHRSDVSTRPYRGGLRNTDYNSHRRPHNFPDEEEEIKV